MALKSDIHILLQDMLLKILDIWHTEVLHFGPFHWLKESWRGLRKVNTEPQSSADTWSKSEFFTARQIKICLEIWQFSYNHLSALAQKEMPQSRGAKKWMGQYVWRLRWTALEGPAITYAISHITYLWLLPVCQENHSLKETANEMVFRKGWREFLAVDLWLIGIFLSLVQLKFLTLLKP